MLNSKLVVLTGSGISAESGLKTFRDSGGLWEGYDLNEVASIAGWKRNPQKVLDFYNFRREQASNAEPNEAHKALVRLEEKFDVIVVTQNVDNLHERAGSSRVLHLHGELTKVRSEANETLIQNIGSNPISIGDLAEDGEQLRPDIVWFGEMVPMMEPAMKLVSQADFLIVVGTSLAVYPAASLIHFCKEETQKFIIDPVILQIDKVEEWWIIQNTACKGVPELVEQLLSL